MSSTINSFELPRRLNRSRTILHYSHTAVDPDNNTRDDLLTAGVTRSASGQLWDHLKPGAEPGIDTTADIPEPRFASLVSSSQTSLVDFSSDKIQKHEFTGSEKLLDFLEKPREDWAKCRWINVNGLDWKIIKALGNKYKLHRLAIEDLIAPGGRAKVDWYPGNVFGE
jgi:hypothetical protein